MIVRNEFATYLYRRTRLSRTSSDYGGTQSQISMPSLTFPRSQAKLSANDESDQTSAGIRGDDLIAEMIEIAGENVVEDNGRPLLPPPIDDLRSCKWCYARDACMLFRRVGRFAVSPFPTQLDMNTPI